VAPWLRLEMSDRITLDGEDVTEALRARDISEAASRAASDPAVREAMVAEQRRLLNSSPPADWVAEGRDIGTVVCPNAAVKVFLTASPEERARRRAEQIGADQATVLAEQTIRDERDAQREHSPLRRADDAVELDTTGMTLDEVVARIVALVPGR
jgi:cytidylate kinase